METTGGKKIEREYFKFAPIRSTYTKTPWANHYNLCYEVAMTTQVPVGKIFCNDRHNKGYLINNVIKYP